MPGPSRRDRITGWLGAHPWLSVTVVSAVLFVLAASIARAFTYPPLNGGDEPAHFDYVISVWHGHLPVFENGLTYRAPFGASTPVQWVSQHPPLYYLVLAPVVAPLFDSGHALLAVMAGRGMSALMTGGVVLASAWAAWRCFPGHRRLPGGVAIVTALAGMVIQQGGSIYNDVLFVLFSVLACGIAGAAIRSGMGGGLFIGAVLVCAGGMTTRLSFALWMVALLVAIVLARRVRLWRLSGVRARIVAVLGPVVAAGAASGWFYLHNKATAGNFSGRHAEWGLEHMGRVVRPRLDVAFDGTFWTGLYGVYRGVLPQTDLTQWFIMLVPMALAAAAGVWVLLRRRRTAEHPSRRADGREQRLHRLRTALVVAMLVAVTILLSVIEIGYVHGGGAPNTRYALTVMIVIAMVMAAGLTAVRRASGVLLTLWIAAAFIPYLSLVDLHVVGIVPHAARVVQFMVALSVVAAVGCVVGAFLDARRAAGPDAHRAGPEARRDGPDAHRAGPEARQDGAEARRDGAEARRDGAEARQPGAGSGAAGGVEQQAVPIADRLDGV
ncbi:ArnT family glycosyltransferase [Curtobacterium sp. Leaf261]|uniref:ArnT family glycosyltransferase n=1 Tax=Curtobacterium sp. Leaf261 TaxID=1736311 RepID=UPI0006F3ACBC|nr:hypothetical protein [Curtobacterium sp. Leaf261]KQO62177.1 hypothetical protein ASF23_10125 [Curtobacterium sp. Leaf261]